ncbi:MAG: glycosyltransferase family protein, partial [Planctomycetota bacterium]
SASSYLGMLETWQPDLVIEIDHLQHEKSNILPAQLPHIAWVQDRLPNLFNNEAASQIGDLQLVIGAGVREMVLNHGFPEAQCTTIVNGTDTSIYSDAPLPETELAPHRCDIAWVSNHSEPPEFYARTLVEQIGRTPAERACAEWAVKRVFRLFEYADQIEPTLGISMARFFGDSGGTALSATHQQRSGNAGNTDGLPFPLSPEGKRALHNFLVLPLADRISRHQVLQWTIDYCRQRDRRFRLYGEGWERYADTQAWACGRVQAGRELRAVYQAAKVNLHMSVYGSLHQRTFDGFASGGFVLCRRTQGDVSAGLVRAAMADMDRLDRSRLRLEEAPSLRAFIEREFLRGNPLPAAFGQQCVSAAAGLSPTGRAAAADERRGDGAVGLPRSLVEWLIPLGWDFGRDGWAWWFRPRTPCNFRSYDDLVPDIGSVTFATRDEFFARLDELLDGEGNGSGSGSGSGSGGGGDGDGDVRERLAAPIRQRVVEEVSTDAIATSMIDRMTTRIRTRAAGGSTP